jgi:hypothetical protein
MPDSWKASLSRWHGCWHAFNQSLKHLQVGHSSTRVPESQHSQHSGVRGQPGLYGTTPSQKTKLTNNTDTVVFVLLYLHSLTGCGMGPKDYLICFLLILGFFEIGSWYVAQAGLKLMILLPQPLQCWDYRLWPPFTAQRAILFSKQWEAQVKKHLFCYFWDWVLLLYSPGLERSFCLSLTSAGITDTNHYVQFAFCSWTGISFPYLRHSVREPLF